MEDRWSIANESRNKQGIQNISTEHDEAHNANKQIFEVFIAGFVAVSITTNVELKVAKDEEKVRETLREREVFQFQVWRQIFFLLCFGRN